MCALSEVQLGANTIARRVTAMSANVTEQLEQDFV